MHQVVRGLREIPLDVATQSRVVIEDAQRNRAQPLAAVSEHLQRTMVEIEMPQSADVLGFVAADLARLSPFFRHDLTRASAGRSSVCVTSREPA